MNVYSVETQKFIISALLKYIEFHNKQISLKISKSHFKFKRNFINEKKFEEFLELINLKWSCINWLYINVISKNNKIRIFEYKNS